jgi:3'-phosphoadenosine 5'-phosphosulfate (PAPS) 3'-phosphatase
MTQPEPAGLVVLAASVTRIASEGSAEILRVYAECTTKSALKADNSALALADFLAHGRIVSDLDALGAAFACAL